MFNFSELKSIHLEITNNCQASCPMCSRNFHGGIENPLLSINSWTINDFKDIMTKKVLDKLDYFYFCGNFGDPILNNDLLEMCDYSTQTRPDINYSIHTNGSARGINWWKDLAKVLSKNHNVVFALDGLSDTHSIYRIGTNYETILRNASAFIEAGGIAEWCFIKFKHNEHQVDQARQIAKDLSFTNFTMKNSSRFVAEDKYPVLDKFGEVIYNIEPPTETVIKFIDKKMLDNYKSIVQSSVIDCFVKKDRQIYIDAYKNVFPCCWTASTPYNYINNDDIARNIRYKILEQYNEIISEFGGIDKLNATTHGIESILDSTAWNTIWENHFTENKFITCARICGSNVNISKPIDQFIENTHIQA